VWNRGELFHVGKTYGRSTMEHMENMDKKDETYGRLWKTMETKDETYGRLWKTMETNRGFD
jgi:hypothetical protein